MAIFQDPLSHWIVIWLGFLVLNDFSQTVNGDQILTCENETMTINCMANTTIIPTEVKYGQPFAGYHCGGRKYDQGYVCLSSKAETIVNERCQDKTSCNIPVNEGTFGGRPCPNNIPVYLHVTYYCAPSPSVSPKYTPAILSYPPAIVSQSSIFSDSVQSCSLCVGCTKCLGCSMRDIAWPETPPGSWATAQCPNNQNLHEARLLCGSDPVGWVGHPDLSKCVSPEVSSFQTQLKNVNDIQSLDALMSNLVGFAEAQKSLAGGDLIGLCNILYDAVKKFGIFASDKTNETRSHVHHISSSVVKLTDDLLDSNRKMSWVDVPKTNWGSLATKLTTSVETSAFHMAEFLHPAETRVNITTNILLEVSKIEVNTSSAARDIIFPNAEALKGSSWENTHNSFRIPVEALFSHNSSVKVVFASYNNLEYLLLPNSSRTFCSGFDDSDSCDAVINTRVISASVDSPMTEGHDTKLNNPVVFILEHRKTENMSNSICAFWKLSESDGEGGEWSDEGCSLVTSNLTHTTCSCDHLTSFAVIMSPTSPEVTDANALALDILTYIGCSISIICLFLSFLTFACFRNLQCDRNTIHKNLVLCLFIANMIFLIGIDLASLEIFCSVIAGFLHYFFLTVFAWMCIEGIQLYYMVVEVFETDKSHVLWFYLSAYGVPAVIVIISASVYHEGYGTDQYCWLTTEKGFIWAFIGPAAAIILVNTVMLAIAVRAMCIHTSSAAAFGMKKKSKLQQMRSWVKGSVVLIVLLGLTWAFGFAFVSEATIAFAYIFTILNSLQGLFIFIFHCLLNDKVQIEYKRRIRRAEWLPERFRVWYAGPSGSSYNSNPNQMNSGTGGGRGGGGEGGGEEGEGGGKGGEKGRGVQWSRLLLCGKRNSQSNLSSITVPSQEQSLLRKEENARPDNAVIASDSGVEDSSNYLEPTETHLGEDWSDALGLSSTPETQGT